MAFKLVFKPHLIGEEFPACFFKLAESNGRLPEAT